MLVALAGIAPLIGAAVAADPIGRGAHADRGAAAYVAHCASCHGVHLEGATAVALTGEHFETRWARAGLSVDDLFYIVSTQMPSGAPGSLPDDAYLEIVAHLLRVNRYRMAEAPLPADARARAAMSLAR